MLFIENLTKYIWDKAEYGFYHKQCVGKNV